jgi:hypothetical protein
MIESLNISLDESPTRQKIWRVVVFLAPLIFAGVAAILLIRISLVVDTLSAFAPTDATMGLRIMTSPKTSAVLEDDFSGVTLFPNAPWSVNDLASWSRQSSELFFGETGVIGLAVDGKVPASTLTEARALGFTVTERFRGTYIGTTAPTKTHFSFRLPVLMLFPWFNAEAYGFADKKGAPARLVPGSLTISGLGRPSLPNDTNTANTDILAKIAVSSEETQRFMGFEIPLVFPGLNALQTEMRDNGFNFTLGTDGLGTAYTLAIPGGNLTKEDLESTVNELFYAKSITTVEYKDVYARLDEIVSNSAVKPVTSTVPGATVTSIGDNNGAIVRAAQTVHNLVLANRAVVIGDNASQKTPKDTCLPRSGQWIKIQKLSGLLPAHLTTPGMTIATKFLQSEEIAFSKTKTRVCW